MDMDQLGPLVAWPLMLLAAWSAGEWVFRHWNLPRVCAYAAIGLALGGAGGSERRGLSFAQSILPQM